MEVIINAADEQEILACVSDEATPEAIRDSIEARAECCVDALCGCSN